MTATPWDVAPAPVAPVEPVMPHEACERCQGTGGVPVGPALMPGELEYDECPECIGSGLNVEARRDRADLLEERYQEWWA